MLYLVINRVYKVATGRTGQFEPRSAGVRETLISGPFNNPQTGQKAMVAVLKTFTCLSAKLVNETQLRKMAVESGGNALMREMALMGIPTREPAEKQEG